jgi:cytochrome c biogenesis protein CcmG/thiol:disulfide interchange protein DsbE
VTVETLEPTAPSDEPARVSRAKLALQAIALALVAGLFALLAWSLSTGDDEAAIEGRAPAFTLPRLDGGGSLSLASYRGRGVVLNFWASWCEPCEDEAEVLEQTWQRNRSRGLVVLGVDANDFESDARRFVDRNGMTYPVVHDGPGETLRDYKVKGFPVTFFIDRRGNIVGEPIIGPVDGSDEVLRRFARNVEQALAP